MSDIKRPTRWSYSSISTYEQCPQKWKFSYIDNLPWASSAAMSRGTRLHQMAEDYVNGVVDRVPHEVQKIGILLDGLKQKKAKAEAVWLLDQHWQPTQVDDNNLNPDFRPKPTWVKTIVDVHYVAGDILYVKDYKSGRQMYDDHRTQLELYGIVGLVHHPEVKRVETSAVYIDTGFEGMEGSIIRPMLPKLIAKWEDKAQTMMKDEVWEPKPGRACNWCDYAKAKGGPCVY